MKAKIRFSHENMIFEQGHEVPEQIAALFPNLVTEEEVKKVELEEQPKGEVFNVSGKKKYKKGES